jgi:hypothetical protein
MEERSRSRFRSVARRRADCAPAPLPWRADIELRGKPTGLAFGELSVNMGLWFYAEMGKR